MVSDSEPRPGSSADFVSEADPLPIFDRWMEEAKTSEPNDANAMALATVDADGLPDVRMVLLKGVDAAGFVFYTNTESAKGRELEGNPKAAVVFHWKSLRRQIRVRGPVERVSDEEADAYFQSRPRDSRIGAWASQQSRPLESRFALEKAVAAIAARYPVGMVPRPPHWTGFRIRPVYMEFWQDRPFRLHERTVFRRPAPEGAWSTERLYP
jgi:pyridoxamine 5'-phosphate oxidase